MSIQTSTETSQGSRTRNVIVIAIISVLLICVTGYSVTRIAISTTQQKQGPNAAEIVAQNFYAAIQHQQYAAAYAYLSPDQQAKITQYSFTLFAKEQDIVNGPVTSFKEQRYDRDTNAANQGTVQMFVTRSKGITYTIHLQMIQESDGSWKIREEDRPI